MQNFHPVWTIERQNSLIPESMFCPFVASVRKVWFLLYGNCLFSVIFNLSFYGNSQKWSLSRMSVITFRYYFVQKWVCCSPKLWSHRATVIWNMRQLQIAHWIHYGWIHPIVATMAIPLCTPYSVLYRTSQLSLLWASCLCHTLDFQMMLVHWCFHDLRSHCTVLLVLFWKGKEMGCI